MNSLKAQLLSDGKLYYSEHFAFFTKNKKNGLPILLKTNEDVSEFMIEFNLTDKDTVDLRRK